MKGIGVLVEAIYSWVKNIAFCLIITSIVLNVLPDNNYKKYVKVFTGILLVIVIISPLDIFGNITLNIGRLFDTISIESDVKELTNNIEKEQESYLESNIAIYKDKIKEQINEQLQDDQYVVKTLDFTIGANSGILGMDIVITKEGMQNGISSIGKITIGNEDEYTKDKQALILKIKNFIKDFYNLETSNINISIQR